MKADNFGNYIRYLRNKNNIGQRELARIIGTSASYLNDIEKNKRPAPREEILDILFDILKAERSNCMILQESSKIHYLQT